MDPQAVIGLCCGAAWTPTSARLERSGPHWKATCGACGKYLCFLPQRAGSFRLPFGKYRGTLLVELWGEDPAYCRWLKDRPWLKSRLREVLAETEKHSS